MLNKFIRAIGFTNTEAKAVIFLIVLFLTGFSYKHFYTDNPVVQTEFSYFEQDSLFNSALRAENETEDTAGISNKVVDYKQEVLDFNTQDFKAKKRLDLLMEKSININTAGLFDLIRLPGIGETTARNILKYRDSNGKFRNLEELMNVQRIGEKRFSQIKKYIFIE